jgi:acyl-CoA thioesterase-1
VCFGDSLTTCGGPGGRYSDFLAAWLPGAEIINRGIAGDTLAGGRARFDADVLSHAPGVVVIQLGANDYWAASRPLPDLRADLECMVRACRERGAQVVIASCFGESDGSIREEGAQADRRARYAGGIARFEREIADQYGAFYVPNMQVDIKPNGGDRYWCDRNHPNKRGNELVARRIMEQLRPAIAASRD